MKSLKIYEEFISKELENKFNSLKHNWINDIGYQSNPSIIYENENYKAIVSLGKKIVPILIKDLNENDGDWLFALTEILKINPIKKENIGNWNKMKNDWNKYLNENDIINTSVS